MMLFLLGKIDRRESQFNMYEFCDRCVAVSKFCHCNDAGLGEILGGRF